ncbi:single-stranded-DNA-specific exonuclease RecJ [Alkaliphilus peptidifermentans]|uniref:Single-stranded-DNA-specific exonuclease RecJ n=1 Tax=Alkaliphilus peptidifermentans DSM 18978 TaxID=1120976 RepID=A0A1G5L4Y3_9FIRM|nr:single-stranded-DNA-specific exonuclease RecJ [Alkaliphilus peptidifermentans]SCZ07249.1 single-stranded-DNA-specific exonuclease [Alkaliphilus peptidifermentans DSM 18978]
MLEKKIWTFKKADEDKINSLVKELNISTTTAKLLFNRGILDVEDAKIFLNSSLEYLHDPFLLKNMEKVVKRIKNAVEGNESIWIYGDYDVDGVSSTALLVRYFKSIGYSVESYIPHRMEEGYGVNCDAIKEISENGGQLIITVDCGITSVNEVAYANELGIDVIISDHHECQEELPAAYGIINPKQTDCGYPFKMLCGCGIALKIIQALMPKVEFIKEVHNYIDIAALATVADIVTLTDENRIIVKNGMKAMESSSNEGIRALLEVCGLKDKKINGGHIGFMLAPRINAAGRIGNAKIGVRLLTCDDYSEAIELAKFLDDENRERQHIEMEIFKQAIKQLEEDPELQNRKFLVLYNEGWHHGVIGIVASRIVEKYYKPTIIMSLEDGEAKGSARSIPGFNIFEALSSCKDMFIKFGGHEQAAGLSMKQEKLAEFKESINNKANEALSHDDFIREISFDDHLAYNEIDDKIISELELLEPHGMGNPGPKFICRSLKVSSIQTVGAEGKHLRVELINEGKKINGIAFGLGYLKEYIQSEDLVEVIFVPEYNIFNGYKNLQMNIKDMKVMQKGKRQNTTIYKDYFKNFKFEKAMLEDLDIKLKETRIITEDKKDKIIIEQIYEIAPTVILVNTLNKAFRLLGLMDIRQKNCIREFNVFFQYSPEPPKEGDVHIIINPNIDKIEFSSYNKIILYDQFFSPTQLNKLVALVDTKNLLVFYEADDETHNVEILKDMIPNRDKLITFYNYFKTIKDKSILTIDEIVETINKQNKFIANEILLKGVLEIFKEARLVNYSLNSREVEIELEKPKGKVNLEELETYKNLQNWLNSQNDYQSRLKELYKRRK